MNTLTTIFLFALLLQTLLGLWLSYRQQRQVQRCRDQVPNDFSATISLAEHQKAADYTTAKMTLQQLSLLWQALLLLAWTIGGGLATLDAAIGFASQPLLHGMLVIIAVLLLQHLLQLPFSLYQQFVIEQRFGFNRMTASLLLTDGLKKLLLFALLMPPIIAAVLWFMEESGKQWWLYVWLLWMVLSLLLSWAIPRFIAPLFNRFIVLEQGPLRQRIEALLQRCGFRNGGLFVMDGSRRSGHGNAYFTGLGNARRIVLFDTLLQELEEDEIEAVLAHEIGHFKRHHLSQRLLLMALLSLLQLALLGWLAYMPWFYHGLGLDNISSHGALLLFLFTAPLFGSFLQPLLAWLSRQHEYQADAFAALTSNGERLISALIALYRKNASTLTPDPLYSAFHDSHPSALARIAHLRNGPKTHPKPG